MPKNKFAFNSDIRLNDYANANFPSNGAKRISKNTSSALSALRETKNWWELKQEDFALNSDSFSEDTGDLDDLGNLQTIFSDPAGALSLKNKFGSEAPCSPGHKQYGIDLWFSVSVYIRPEDVCRFALICKQTYFVTRSAAFWKRLYKRFNKNSTTELPDRFGPICIERLYGLRTCVVKSFFYCYQPFVDRLKKSMSCGVHLSGEAISKLCRSTCESFWYEKHESPSRGRHWIFYFKFSWRSANQKCSSTGAVNPLADSKTKLPKRLEILEDIFANLETDCFILKVNSTHFTNVPTIFDWRLSEFSLSLNSDMCTHRVKLKFESATALKTYGKAGNGNGTKSYGDFSSAIATTSSFGPKEIVVLDGVQSLAVLDWWNPNYPLPVL